MIWHRGKSVSSILDSNTDWHYPQLSMRYPDFLCGKVVITALLYFSGHLRSDLLYVWVLKIEVPLMYQKSQALKANVFVTSVDILFCIIQYSHILLVICYHWWYIVWLLKIKFCMHMHLYQGSEILKANIFCCVWVVFPWKPLSFASLRHVFRPRIWSSSK